MGTLVAHSATDKRRVDFVYFHGQHYVLFFELIVLKDVSKEKYPHSSKDSRLKLILGAMSKWMGEAVEVSADKTSLQVNGYKGNVEYVIVSSRTESEGRLYARKQTMADFSWINIMNRDDLAKIFPAPHIEKLRNSMVSF